LIRDLADSPVQAITVLTAQLFKGLVLKGQQNTDDASALQVRATAYSRVDVGPIAALDGEVLGRLERRKEAYMASGLRPIGWVAGMTMGEQTHLLAELVAISLNVRETRTSSLRRNARVEAAEIADLIGSNIAQHWTPDAGYLAVHGKKQLMAMLVEMGSDDARAGSLRKDDLVTFTAEAAAARGFAPKVLSWSLPAPPPPEMNDPNLADDDTGIADPGDRTAEEDAAPPAEAPNGRKAVESPPLLAA
jgi:ParB family transcriptional regulator, chromosome partitioning protein